MTNIQMNAWVSLPPTSNTIDPMTKIIFPVTSDPIDRIANTIPKKKDILFCFTKNQIDVNAKI